MDKLAALFSLAIYGVDVTGGRLSAEPGPSPDSPPSRLALTVHVGGRSLDLNLDPTTHMDSNFPLYWMTADAGGQLHVQKTTTRTIIGLYQDRQQDAAFVMATNINEQGNITHSLEGVVHTGGRTYRLQSEVTRVSTDRSGRPTGRMFPQQQELRFDVHDLKLEHADYLFDYDEPANGPDDTVDGDNNGQRRHRRGVVTQDVYVDVVAMADFGVYSAWYARSTEMTEAAKQRDAMEKLQQYYALIFNGVNLIYRSLTTLTFTIHVRLVGLIVAQTAASSPWTEELRVAVPGKVHDEVNGYIALDNIGAWVANATLPPHDHFMFFIGYDLTNGTTNNLAGRAWLSAVCNTDGRQTSIIEDVGTSQSFFTAAHELGHSLSAYHDGQSGTKGNLCRAEDRYVMSPGGFPRTESNKLHDWIFSSCSADYFLNYISAKVDTQLGRYCMYETLPVNETAVPDVTSQMLGQIYDVNDQCRLIHGSQSRLCWGVETLKEDKAKVCTYLACRINATTNMCSVHYAARGTTCGNKKWCINGQCVFDTAAPSVERDCVFGDKQGSVFSNGEDCVTAVGNDKSVCYQEIVQDLCCSSCNAVYRPLQNCEYGDTANGCTNSSCSIERNLQICCDTCNYGDPITTPTTTTPTTTTTALLPETTQLTDNCTTVWSNCTRPATNDNVDNATLCTSGQSYITCLADALTTAERRGVCSPLFLLTYRHDAFSEAAVYQHNCPGFTLPGSLALDGCGIEVAVCGRSARNVHVANSTGDSVTKCRELRTFQSCMETNTSRCADRNLVNNLLLKELVDYQCVPCGVVRASRPSSRIVGGSATGANQFPWVVMLVENGRFICGGGLIDPLHVVTAAHCVKSADSYDGFLNMSAFEIVAGKHRASLAVSYSGEQRVSVAAAVLHPRYEDDPGFSANDIAVLRLDRPLTFNSKVSALCLPERTARLPEQCVVAGWGRDGVGLSFMIP